MIILLISCSRDNYEELLSVRIKEIEALQFFDNSYVVYIENEGYGSTYSRWTSDMEFYQDDMVLDSGGHTYRALTDSRGKNPKTSPGQWKQIPWKHPYFFLRDTAKTQDLKKLLTNKHPFIKTYAFAALAHKSSDGLFDVIIDNLSDTTRMAQMTGDHGFDVYPADLMISYTLSDLKTDEREQLQKLIDTKYNHLTYAKELMADK